MGSTFDVKYDLILAVLSQIFEKLPIFFLQTCLGVMDIGSFRKKHVFFFVNPYGNAWLSLTFLDARGWSEHIFAASARLRASTEKLALSPYSAVYGGQRDTESVTIE